MATLPRTHRHIALRSLRASYRRAVLAAKSLVEAGRGRAGALAAEAIREIWKEAEAAGRAHGHRDRLAELAGTDSTPRPRHRDHGPGRVSAPRFI